MKVGGEKVVKTEARIIAATNQNLRTLIESGKFREDLYYRLKSWRFKLLPSGSQGGYSRARRLSS